MKRMVLASLALGAARLAIPAAQSPTLDQLLDRLGAYLIVYETELSSIVAEEEFDQVLYGLGAKRAYRQVKLESEVAFLRLPGGAEWLGFRDVRKVNWKAVRPATTISISEVLASSAGDVTKARAIANASARHNLGLPRTINVPTAALEIIHPRHRHAHRFWMLGSDRVRGTPTAVIAFEETGRPTLLRDIPTNGNLVSRGRVWVEPGSGAIRRVEWQYESVETTVAGPTPELRIEFEPHDALGILVPTRMTEVFSVQGGRGEGRASYKNFRRFGTAARIVPQ
jgi:hypothetical protein